MIPNVTPNTGIPPVDWQSLAAPQEQLATQHDFESIFYAMIVKELRSTLSEGLFSGESTDSYGALFDQFMGQHLAEAQPLGVGKLIARYQDAATR